MVRTYNESLSGICQLSVDSEMWRLHEEIVATDLADEGDAQHCNVHPM